MTANTVFFVVVVPCLGYLTRKIYYQTDELYRKQSRIRGNGSGKCTSTESVDKDITQNDNCVQMLALKANTYIGGNR